MFGTTQPIFGAQGLVSAYVRNPDLMEYVRWEYRPADRSAAIRSLTRPQSAKQRRVRAAPTARIGARLRAWMKALRETPGGPIESGLVYRAMLRQKVL